MRCMGNHLLKSKCAKSIGGCQTNVYNMIKYYVDVGFENILPAGRSVDSYNVQQKMYGRFVFWKSEQKVEVLVGKDASEIQKKEL